MSLIAILLGLKPKPVYEPCLAEERAAKLADLERLLAEIAVPTGC